MMTFIALFLIGYVGTDLALRAHNKLRRLNK